VGMNPHNLVISLNLGEIPHSTSYQYYVMLCLLICCARNRFKCFCMIRDSLISCFKEYQVI
jgi:hypothetical protein